MATMLGGIMRGGSPVQIGGDYHSRFKQAAPTALPPATPQYNFHGGAVPQSTHSVAAGGGGSAPYAGMPDSPPQLPDVAMEGLDKAYASQGAPKGTMPGVNLGMPSEANPRLGHRTPPILGLRLAMQQRVY